MNMDYINGYLNEMHNMFQKDVLWNRTSLGTVQEMIDTNQYSKEQLLMLEDIAPNTGVSTTNQSNPPSQPPTQTDNNNNQAQVDTQALNNAYNTFSGELNKLKTTYGKNTVVINAINNIDQWVKYLGTQLKTAQQPVIPQPTVS